MTFFIALNGILFETRKNSKKRLSWNNINKYGILLITLLILITGLSVIQEILDEKDDKKREQVYNDKMNELREYNLYMLKAIGMEKGYTLSVMGYIQFKKSVSKSFIDTALKNLFVKGAEIEINATNKYGTFKGTTNHSRNIRVDSIDVFLNTHRNRNNRFTRLDEELNNRNNCYFFKIRCFSIYLRNDEKIPYVKISQNDSINIFARRLLYYSAFMDLYHVTDYNLTIIEIEELGYKHEGPLDYPRGRNY